MVSELIYFENLSKMNNKLSPNQAQILKGRGTEPPGSGKFLNLKEAGDYLCAACQHILFKSDHKFDSGSGWPSFYDVAAKDSVNLVIDNSILPSRLEVICQNCRGHLGHRFDDAPSQPTGQRYCINSAALLFRNRAGNLESGAKDV